MMAGKFDRTIRLERNSGTARDSLGAVVDSWTKIKNVPAQVLPVSGSEAFKSDRDIGVRVARFYLRYLEGITEKDRIVYDSENWNVVYIREIGRREGLEILAEVRR